MTRASRFLIGLVTCPAVARAAWHRQVLGGTPTNSVKRLLKVTSDEQPAAKQTSVTRIWLPSPAHSRTSARRTKITKR